MELDVPVEGLLVPPLLRLSGTIRRGVDINLPVQLPDHFSAHVSTRPSSHCSNCGQRRLPRSAERNNNCCRKRHKIAGAPGGFVSRVLSWSTDQIHQFRSDNPHCPAKRETNRDPVVILSLSPEPSSVKPGGSGYSSRNQEHGHSQSWPPCTHHRRQNHQTCCQESNPTVYQPHQQDVGTALLTPEAQSTTLQGLAALPQYSLNEVFQHSEPDDAWIVLYDRVYDVTNFLRKHPGGMEILLENVGRDATVPFSEVGHSRVAHELLADCLVGQVIENERLERAFESPH